MHGPAQVAGADEVLVRVVLDSVLDIGAELLKLLSAYLLILVSCVFVYALLPLTCGKTCGSEALRGVGVDLVCFEALICLFDKSRAPLF